MKGYFSGSTGFRWVELNGVMYPKDFIIHVDGNISKRRKILSRRLPPINYHSPLGVEELTLLSGETPDTINIATGQRGSLPLIDQTEEFLKNYEVRVGKTPEIISKILKEQRRFIAIIL